MDEEVKKTPMPFAVSAVIFQFPFFIRLFALRGHKYRWRLKVYFKYLLQSFFLPQPSRHTIYVFIHLSPHTHMHQRMFLPRGMYYLQWYARENFEWRCIDCLVGWRTRICVGRHIGSPKRRLGVYLSFQPI